MTDADYDYIFDEIERCEKLSLKGTSVLIVMTNITDDNNHNSILYVVVHYRIITCIYVNIIWIFILVSFIFLYSLFTDGAMFILF